MEHTLIVDQQDQIVKLSGEVDLEQAPQTRAILLQAIEQGQTIFVDLSEVSYMDSSGIANLVEAYQHAKKRQLTFELVAASPAVLRVIKMARLDKIFTIHESLESARHG